MNIANTTTTVTPAALRYVVRRSVSRVAGSQFWAYNTKPDGCIGHWVTPFATFAEAAAKVDALNEWERKAAAR